MELKQLPLEITLRNLPDEEERILVSIAQGCGHRTVRTELPFFKVRAAVRVAQNGASIVFGD